MKLRPALCLAFLVLLCTMSPTAADPAPGVRRAAPGDEHESMTLCSGKEPAVARQKALTELLGRYLQGKSPQTAIAQAHSFLPACVQLLPLGSDGLLAHGWWGETGLPALFAWAQSGGWQTAPVDFSGWDLAGYPMDGSATYPGGKPDLLIAGQSVGSGSYGQVLHAAPDNQGTLRACPATPIFNHARFDFLEPHLLLLTYRSSSHDPLVWDCNACAPINDQKLLRWEIDTDTGRFQTIGERRFPEPYLTANLFLGALQAGNLQAAAPYSADPSIPPKAAALLGLPAKGSFPWETVDGWGSGSAELEVRHLEMRDWDLLPPRYRTQLPPDRQQFTMTLTRGEEQVELLLTRRPDDWVVTDVKR
ncbi:MAG: hypothetical protein ACM3XM_06405 [Mycobacterium leprae]